MNKLELLLRELDQYTTTLDEEAEENYLKGTNEGFGKSEAYTECLEHLVRLIDEYEEIND